MPLYLVVWTSGELSNCANPSRASSLLWRLSPTQTAILTSVSSPPLVTSMKCTLTLLIMLSLPSFQKIIRAAFYLRNREGNCQTARCCPYCCTLCPYFISFFWELFLSNQSPCRFQQHWCPQSLFFMIQTQSASLMSDSWTFPLVSLPHATLLTSPFIGKLEPIIKTSDNCSHLIWNI